MNKIFIKIRKIFSVVSQNSLSVVEYPDLSISKILALISGITYYL